MAEPATTTPAAAPAASLDKKPDKAEKKQAPTAKKDAKKAPAAKKESKAPQEKLKKVQPKHAPVATPESVLKKRKTKQELEANRQKWLAKKAVLQVSARKKAFQRAERYVREYRERERGLIRLKRIAKNHGNFYAEPEARLLFVIRIRGILNVSPKVKKILQLLRLRQIHNGVFVRVNKASMNMLRLVEPYITYGPPNLKSIRELIYKRGFASVRHQRLPLSANAVIAQHLGKINIICIEDIIHEIYTVGAHFKEVNNFLYPFKLSCPLGGFTRFKKTHFAEGGDHGNREEYINRLIRQMN